MATIIAPIRVGVLRCMFIKWGPPRPSAPIEQRSDHWRKNLQFALKGAGKWRQAFLIDPGCVRETGNSYILSGAMPSRGGQLSVGWIDLLGYKETPCASS